MKMSIFALFKSWRLFGNWFEMLLLLDRSSKRYIPYNIMFCQYETYIMPNIQNLLLLVYIKVLQNHL